jgi:aryl-alcohol dehydrogenase-like predicted oxidoreductase
MAPPVKLPTRRLGRDGPEIPAIGFGLMGLSMAYGAVGPDEERLAVLDRAWELGCTNWDSADLYGDSEELLGKWFARHPERRADVFLATKFGLSFGLRDDGTPGLRIDSSPANCRRQCEQSLRRLGVDSIDLYYIHRVDGKTPVEKTMEELAKLQAWVPLLLVHP